MGRRGGGGVGFVAGVFLLVSWTTFTSAAFNVTLMLNAHPHYSDFNQLLSSTGVADEINSRTSLTVLVPSNTILAPFLTANPNSDSGEIADVLRYHVLLQYWDISQLKAIPQDKPTEVTTLLQTTGRTAGNDGVVDLTYDATTIGVGLPVEGAPPNASITTSISSMPYNISILAVDTTLIPPGWGTRKDESANITAALEGAVNYKTFIDLLTSTGVDAEYASKQTGAGITVLAPTDAAFAALPPGALAALTPDQAKQVLRYHAIGQYYPLGTLSTLNKVEPTLASVTGGPGTYVIDVTSKATGLVTLSTGASNATIGSTIYDTTPTSVFSINSVLLPPEIFALAPAAAPSPLSPALAPAPALSPVPAPAIGSPVPAPAPGTVPAPASSPSSSPAPAPGPEALVPAPAFAGPPAPPTAPEAGDLAPAPSEDLSPDGNDGSVTLVSRVTLGWLHLEGGMASLPEVIHWAISAPAEKRLFNVWFLAIAWRCLWAERCTLKYESKMNAVNLEKVTYLFLEDLHARRNRIRPEAVRFCAQYLKD
ncbi:hypothetical protein R1sor_026338 [Riccia sorocarpa]|uniref:FAS1 domain-containing protein n=1 Tax=Riccia sorocarpa TaxID=122646 RepID=A0ABD3GED7_9MARC